MSLGNQAFTLWIAINSVFLLFGHIHLFTLREDIIKDWKMDRKKTIRKFSTLAITDVSVIVILVWITMNPSSFGF